MKRRIIVIAFVSVFLLVVFGIKIMLPSHAFIGAEISDPSGDAPSEFDIVSVSFEEDGGYLTIEYRVGGNMSQGGYFIFFDVDRNPNTGCSGYTEMASGIGPEYFIFFNPINYPKAVLCSSYRPWTVVNGDNCGEFRYHQDSFVVFTEFTVRDLGLSRGEEVMIDVAASTYLGGEKDRAPDAGVVTITMFSQDEHDLSVSLKAPGLIKLGESAFLYAMVKNVGLENETNVELQLLIDGSVVDSTATPGLNVGCSEQVDYCWTPTASGTYQVKAYAPPVLGEEFMVDNNATGNPRVRQFATVFVDPLTIEGKVIGENVTVNINVSNATDLYGWQAGMTFNSGCVELHRLLRRRVSRDRGGSGAWNHLG